MALLPQPRFPVRSSQQLLRPTPRLAIIPSPSASFSTQAARRRAATAAAPRRRDALSEKEAARIRRTPEYKARFRRGITLIVAIPILICTSWALGNKLLGEMSQEKVNERKARSRPREGPGPKGV